MLASDRILALDIGASSVKLGEFHTAGGQGLRLANFNHADIGLDPEHEENRKELLLAAIRNMLLEKGIRTGKVIFSVPGQSVFTRFVKLPPVEESKVFQIIQYEAQQNVPFPIDEVIWDYQLVGATEGGGLEVVLLAIKSEIIEELNSSVENAGLNTEMVDVAPMALYNAYRYNEGETAGCTLMVDIGARTTNLLFIENNRVFTRSIPIAGNAITQSIAAEFGKTFQEAEALKKEKGFVALGGAYEEPPDPEQSQISKIIRHVMTRLHSEIARSINFYRTQQGGNAPDRALLSGGSAILPYADRFFKEKLQIPIEYFNPFRNVTLDPGVSRDELVRCAHFFGEIVGLALRRMSECPIEVNLLPHSIRARKQAIQKRPFLAGAAVSVLLIPLCLIGFAQRAATLKQSQLDRVTSQVDQLEQIKSQLVQKQEESDKVRQRIDGVAALIQQRSWWPLLLEDLNGRLVSNVWLVSIAPGDQPLAATNTADMAAAPSPTAGGSRRFTEAMPEAAHEPASAATNAPIAYLRLSGAGNHVSPEEDLKLADSFREQLRGSLFFEKDGVELEVPPEMVREAVFTFVLRAKLAKPIKY
jgi:type IV pilus assembly protein PilM